MKLYKSTPRAEATYRVGDEIIYQYYLFDGRGSSQHRNALTVTKVNKVTLIAEDKLGNSFLLRITDKSITTRDQLIKELNDSIQ